MTRRSRWLMSLVLIGIKRTTQGVWSKELQELIWQVQVLEVWSKALVWYLALIMIKSKPNGTKICTISPSSSASIFRSMRSHLKHRLNFTGSVESLVKELLERCPLPCTNWVSNWLPSNLWWKKHSKIRKISEGELSLSLVFSNSAITRMLLDFMINLRLTNIYALWLNSALVVIYSATSRREEDLRRMWPDTSSSNFWRA